jgi:8-oxo-dGTP diphosphatase
MSDTKAPCPVCGRWPNRSATVAGVVIQDGRLLVITRGADPRRGWPALPGGFLDMDETAADGCRREVREETGIETTLRAFIGVYDSPERSPTQTVSIAFLLEPDGGVLCAGDDADAASWVPLDALPALAFDHARIVADACRLMDNR